MLAAPSDQRDIADEGARIIRHAEGLDTVADYVEAQTTPYRQVRELGEEVPMASRIIKVANAFDDLTGGSGDPDQVRAANERIHLGLGYQYDPQVVEALAVATSDTTRGPGRGARTRRALASGAPPPPRRGPVDRLTPVIFTDAWGSNVSIASLQGRGIPSPQPESELWMGAHEEGPATTDREGAPDLAAVVAADPVGELGKECVERFGPRLPFLLKVLAPGRAISIQAHPSAEQATRRAGHQPVTRSTSTTGPSPSCSSRSRRSRCSSGMRSHAEVADLVEPARGAPPRRPGREGGGVRRPGARHARRGARHPGRRGDRPGPGGRGGLRAARGRR